LDTFGSASITVAQVSQKLSAGSAEAVAFAETLPEALQTMLIDTPQSFKLKLGKALEKHRDTCFGIDNLRLERGPNDRKNVGTWRVIEAVAGSAGSASPRHVQQNSDLFSSVNEGRQEEKDAYEHRGENSLHSLHSQENTLLPDILQHGSTSGESLVSAASDALCSEIGHATLPAPSECDDGPSLDSLRELYTAVKAHLPHFAPHGTVLWKVPGSGFEEGMVSRAQYCQRLLSCCKSGDVSRMQAAQAEMQVRLGKGEA
jgi:hypothetical protein